MGKGVTEDVAYGWQPVFAWGSHIVTATTNQLDLTNNMLTPSVTYMPARGFYIPYTDFDQRVFSAVPSGITNFVLSPSTIIF